MKILWIVNTIFPYPAKQLNRKETVFGGWMLGLMESLIQNKNVNLGVATVYDGSEVVKYTDERVTYYLLPSKNNCHYEKSLEKDWKFVYEDFLPDLVHLHGTEYVHGLPLLRIYPNIKSVASIQGLVSLYGRKYLLNISNRDIIRNITLRDLIRRDTMYQARNKFLKREKYEKEILQKVTGIIGRTTWDYSATLEFANIEKYYFCNESLRNEFYTKEWKYENVRKNTIFISSASYSIKGFHEFLKALPIVKKKYPNVQVYIAGSNILDKPTLKNRIKQTGYARYLSRLIKKYNLEENIKFTGLLDEKNMARKMLECNLFVQASVIENSPNSLGEAMLLGMPIVASNVGGTSDMIKDKEEGLLYPYAENNLLANYIINVFDNPDEAIKMGKKAREHALITHDRKTNTKAMMQIYSDIINK